MNESHPTTPPPPKSATTLDPVPNPLPAQAPTGPVGEVFRAWVVATNRTSATTLSPKRRRLIGAALGTYALGDVLDAVRGWRHSPHHCGENDRAMVYNDLELLLRDAEHIERFRDLERNRGPAGMGQARGANRSLVNGARWKAGRQAREAAR